MIEADRNARSVGPRKSAGGSIYAGYICLRLRARRDHHENAGEGLSRQAILGDRGDGPDAGRPTHIELLGLLKDVPCQAIASGYPSELYDQALEEWKCVELQVIDQDGVRTEKLWMSFTVDHVQWASFAGKNFTDRHRIKRKAANWGRRYEKLPRDEREAVLAAMMAVETQP